MEERESMADLVLDRESNDMEGACSEVGVKVEDGMVGSKWSDILEREREKERERERERLYWIIFQLNYYGWSTIAS